MCDPHICALAQFHFVSSLKSKFWLLTQIFKPLLNLLFRGAHSWRHNKSATAHILISLMSLFINYLLFCFNSSFSRLIQQRSTCKIAFHWWSLLEVSLKHRLLNREWPKRPPFWQNTELMPMLQWPGLHGSRIYGVCISSDTNGHLGDTLRYRWWLGRHLRRWYFRCYERYFRRP